VKNTRRLKRMARAKKNASAGLNLTSLMDVFTILVLYLLVNQSATEVLEPPKDIKLPDSVVESKPRQTVTMMVSDTVILLQGEPVMSTPDLIAGNADARPLIEALKRVKGSAIGLNTEAIAKSNEVTILANRKVPFKVLKSLMTLCTIAGYTKISLAVNQKASQNK